MKLKLVNEDRDWNSAISRRSPRLSPKTRTVFDTKVWSVLTPATTCASSSWSLRLARDLIFSGSTETSIAGWKGTSDSGPAGETAGASSGSEERRVGKEG